MMLCQLRPWKRVQLHPGTDLWMRGARYATVTRVGRKWAYIALDVRPGKEIKIAPENLLEIES